MHHEKLPRSFYLRPTLTVAKDLLGKLLVRKLGKKTLAGRIVEVEAYLGEIDPASHAYRGKTKRNEVMFLEGGHLYVYFTYGMHFCSNVVTERRGKGRAILLRALEPLRGMSTMVKNRGGVEDDTKLTSGPARLCQALAIGRKENGIDLTGSEIYIGRGAKIASSRIGRTRRIGIRKGAEKPWRFHVKGSRFVSRP